MTEKTEFILDGGNVVKCYGTAIMTDKVFQEIFPIIIPRDTDIEDIYGHRYASHCLE